MFQSRWLLFSWSVLCIVEVTVQVPVLEDDSWNLDWPLDLDLNDDGSRSVKTTRPLIILCRDNDLVTRRPPGNDEHFILVKPTGEQSLSTKGPCLVTRHPPVLRRTSTPKTSVVVNANLALWPAIVVGTPSSGHIDDDALQNVANQLLNTDTDVPGEIIHGNLINTPPTTPNEIEVPCGCDGDGDDDDVHTHEYLPNDDVVKTPSTHKPVTSNVINFQQGKQTDSDPPPTTTPLTTTQRVTSPTVDDDVPILTRKPEESLPWSAHPHPTTTPKTRFVTKIVTSISGTNDVPITTLSTTTQKIATKIATKTTTTKIPPISKPITQADDPEKLGGGGGGGGGALSGVNTSQITSIIGNGKLMRWLHFLSKQALFILLALFIFGFINKKNDTTTSTSYYYPPNIVNDVNSDVDYSNLVKIYDNVLTSLNTGYREDVGYNNNNNFNYPLPTNYANSQDSDVYEVNSNENLVQLDYILNVINDANNFNYSNSALKGYG